MDDNILLQISPNLSLYVLKDNTALLRGDTRSTLIEGELAVSILEMCSDCTNLKRIFGNLGSKFSREDIQTSLNTAVKKHYVSVVDESVPLSALWPTYRMSPESVKVKLAESCVAVFGSEFEKKIKARLKHYKVNITKKAESADLTFYLTSDFSSNYWEQFFRLRKSRNQNICLIHANGAEIIFGPILGPTEVVCWHCMARSFLRNRPVERYLKAIGHNIISRKPIFLDGVIDLVVVEALKWLVLASGTADLSKYSIRVDGVTLTISRHRPVKWPQCPECGDLALSNPDREPLPPELDPLEDHAELTAGGMRSKTPDETYSDWSKLVDPLFGVVSSLQVPESVRGMFFAQASTDIGGADHSLDQLHDNLTFRALGKGANTTEASVSALGEAFERYSIVYKGDEVRRFWRFDDFDGKAIHPNQILLFSERQYDTGVARIERFDPTERLSWSPIWSLITESWRWVPTELMYFSVPSNRRVSVADSNGIAAGNTLSEAVVQGFLELIERDAFAIWWKNCISRPPLSIGSLRWRSLDRQLEVIRKSRRELRLLDISNDTKIPVIAAVSWIDRAATGQKILVKAGAHFNPKIAAARAVGEILQYLASRKIGWSPRSDIIDWLETVTTDSLPQLSQLNEVAEIELNNTFEAQFPLAKCLRVARNLSMDLLVSDVTRPEVGVPVVRVIVPGLRHYWERHAPGRLYDVPVNLGWLEEPTSEENLHKLPPYISPSLPRLFE